MALSTATLQLLVSLKDEASGGLASLGGAVGKLGMVAGGVALAGVAALGAAVVSGIGDAREAALLNAQTAQTIATMGNAAGRSAEQVIALAGSLSDAAGASLFGDDQIQASQNLLLTFGEIKGETFDLATALSVDLAQALGGAPADQAMMLGKALNDPIHGMSALGKAGLTFSEEQKAVITRLQETGDMAGAQAIIIAELNKQVGGSAAAAAAADGGWAQFNGRMGEAKEAVGAALLPLLSQLAGFLVTTIAPAVEAAAAAFTAWLADPAVQAGIAQLSLVIQTGLAVAFDYIAHTAIPALISAWVAMQPAIASTAAYITGTLIPALATMWAYFNDNILPILVDVAVWLRDNVPPAMAAVSDFVTGTLLPALAQMWAYISANVLPIIASVVTWFKTNVPPAMAAVSTFITGTLVPAFTAIWTFIQANVIPILSALANVAIALVMLQVRALSALWTGVLQPALDAVWSFIDKNLMPTLSALGSYISASLGPAISGMGSTLGPVAGWFGDISDAVSGVVDWLEKLAEKINSISIPDWAKGASPPPLADWFSYIASAAQDATAAMGDVSLPAVSLPNIASGAGASGAGIGGALVFNIDARGSAMSESQFEAVVRRVLGEAGNDSLNRVRTGN